MITSNPAVANGEPCIRDTKFTVKQLQKLLPYNSDTDIIEAYPFLTFQDITFVRSLNGKIPEPKGEVLYNISDMKIAYETAKSVPFEEWITSYNSGVVVEPPPYVEPVVETITPPDDPNSQNLP